MCLDSAVSRGFMEKSGRKIEQGGLKWEYFSNMQTLSNYDTSTLETGSGLIQICGLNLFVNKELT